MSLPPIFVVSHLGLGDTILQNGAMRFLAKTREVKWACGPLKVSYDFMVRDQPSIEMVPVQGIQDLGDHANKNGWNVLKVGTNNPDRLIDHVKWDVELYQDLGVPFGQRWCGFKVEREKTREIMPPDFEYALVHDCPHRGFNIDRSKVSLSIPIVSVYDFGTGNIFDYIELLLRAKEIHVIDSCFGILADSLDGLTASRLVRHGYARPGSNPPSLWRYQWEII